MTIDTPSPLLQAKLDQMKVTVRFPLSLPDRDRYGKDLHWHRQHLRQQRPDFSEEENQAHAFARMIAHCVPLLQQSKNEPLPAPAKIPREPAIPSEPVSHYHVEHHYHGLHWSWLATAFVVIVLLVLSEHLHCQTTVIRGTPKGSTPQNTATVTAVGPNNNGLDVNIVGGGGSGGTASNFGAAFPATGTAIGVKNGPNMVNLFADSSGNLLTNCTVGCAGGSSNAIRCFH